MTKFNAILTKLNRQLSEDPYCFDLLFLKVLALIALDDIFEASNAFSLVAKLPGLIAQKQVLLSLLNGSTVLVYNEGVWFILDKKVNYQNRQHIVEVACLHYKQLSKFKNAQETSVIVVEVSTSPVSLLDYSLEGVNLIRLSAELDTKDEFSSALAHELSHVFWPCENRVIAEGIALYFESLLAPNESFISSNHSALNIVQKYPHDLPSLDILLSSSFSNDIFFTENTNSSDEQLLIYNIAFLLIAQFVDVNGVKRISSLAHAINVAENGKEVHTFLSFFDDKLPSFLNGPSNVMDRQEQCLDLSQIESVLREDRVGNEQKAFDKYYTAVEANYSKNSKNAEVCILKIRLLLVKLYKQISERKTVHNLSLCLVEELINRLDASKYAKERSFFLAKNTLIRLVTSRNALEMTKLRPVIEAYFLQSLGEHQFETEACIDYAKFELATPKVAGRDLNKAKDLYLRIMHDSRYQKEIDKLKNDIDKELLCA